MAELLIDEYNELRIKGMRAYDIGDYNLANELFIKASSVAAQIAARATSPSTKMQFSRLSKDLFEFAGTKCKDIATNGNVDEVTKEDKKNTSSKVTFDDIAGLEDVKQMLKLKVVYPLLKPERASKYKFKPLKTMQIMLYGPPGTGKTMFADALSNELKMTLHRAKASELIDPYLGVSSKKLQDFLNDVKKDESERILIFIDEFDAIAQSRTNEGGGASGEMNRLVNTLLQEVDDLVKSNTNKMMVFLVTTNRPWAIDSAVLRGKRFDTQIYIGLPDQDARLFLIKKILSISPMDDTISIEAIAKKLDGYSAADITAICEKITDLPLMRDYLTDKEQKITLEDVNKVINSYRNSITQEMLDSYIKYQNGEKIV